MITWLEIALLVLKIADKILSTVNDSKSFQAGVDAEIAKVSASIMRKTEAGKKIMEKIDAMSESEVDTGLLDLEPSDAKNVQ